MANELTIGKNNMVSLVSDNPLGELIKPLSHEILLFDSYVAGTTHIKKGQSSLFCASRRTALTRMPSLCLMKRSANLDTFRKRIISYLRGLWMPASI